MPREPSTNRGGLIRCTGPCRKRFRSEIVTTDRSVANVLLASDPAETGLYWFCPACRPPTTTVQPDEDELEDFLPPELWLMIFEYLDETSMLQVRLTCHRWKAVVDGNCTLRDGFSVEFEELTMDRGYRPENLPPTARASLQTIKVVELGSWWASFGAGLTTLGLYDCEVALVTLLGMLKGTPNLEDLRLSRIGYSSVEAVAVDFRLERLRYLGCKVVFNVFGQMFPGLVHLNVDRGECNEEAVCNLIRSAESTLKYLTCHLTPYMLEKIAGMSRLRLEYVELSAESASAVQLSRMQRFIEDLIVTATNEELHEIGKNLHRLREVFVTLVIEEPMLVPSFLVDMPQLTYLSLKTTQKKLNFGSFKSPNLKILRLNSVKITIDSLKTYLLNCPNVQNLELNTCTLNSWSDLFVVLVPPSLRRLTLWRSRELHYPTVIHNPQQYTINDLDIFDCEIPRDILVQLILQCPRLEKLTFRRVNSVTDEIVAIVCQLPRLQELTIFCCPSVTDLSAGLLFSNCAHLRSVSFTGCNQLSKTARKQLEQLDWTR